MCVVRVVMSLEIQKNGNRNKSTFCSELAHRVDQVQPQGRAGGT